MMRAVCGFSISTEELVFEQEVDTPVDVLRSLFALDKDDPMVDVIPIITDSQKAFFAENFKIDFKPSNEYQLHAYQG